VGAGAGLGQNQPSEPVRELACSVLGYRNPSGSGTSCYNQLQTGSGIPTGSRLNSRALDRTQCSEQVRNKVLAQGRCMPYDGRMRSRRAHAARKDATMKFRPRTKGPCGPVTTRAMRPEERWAPTPMPIHARPGFDPRFSRKDRG
jgi:hypothetical protein